MRTRWARLRSITSCTSSSRSICAAELIAVGGAARDRPRVGRARRATRRFGARPAASAGGARSRRARGSCAARTRRACGRRDPSSPGTIAVCGIGMPSGWRKSAVTANQSARPPTIAASIVARTIAEPRPARLERARDDEEHGGRDEQQRRATLHRVELRLARRLVVQDLHRARPTAAFAGPWVRRSRNGGDLRARRRGRGDSAAGGERRVLLRRARHRGVP